MFWEIHDGEVGNSLVAIIKNVICDYDYQYEQKVIDVWADFPTCVEIRICTSYRGKPFKVIKRGEKW